MDNNTHNVNTETYLASSNEALGALREKIERNRDWFLFLGIGQVILGLIALASGVYGTVFSTLLLGAITLGAGILQLIQAFRWKGWANFFLHLFLGILYSVSGAFIIYEPVLNAVFLTLFLAVFFVISGISRAVFALTTHTPNRFWVIISGILNVTLGVLIYKQWPASGLWVLGAFLGIDLLVTGWTWILLALKSKKV